MGNRLCPAKEKDQILNMEELGERDKDYQQLIQEQYTTLPEHYQITVDQQTGQHPRKVSITSVENVQPQEESARKWSGHYEKERKGSFLLEQQMRQQKSIIVADMLLSDGWKYSGELLRGLPEGQGEEFGSNGDYYTGSFKNGQKNGFGVYRFSNESTYRGQFKDNMMHGSGVFQFPNGDRFEGNFVNNMREGRGKYYPRQPNIDGMLQFQGQYHNDLKNGPGVIRYEGSEVRGVWKNGSYDYSFS